MMNIEMVFKLLGPYAACIVSRQGYGYVFEKDRGDRSASRGGVRVQVELLSLA